MPYAGPRPASPSPPPTGPVSRPAESSRLLLVWTAALLGVVLLLRSDALSGLDRFGLAPDAFDPARWVGELLRLSNLLLAFLLKGHLSFLRLRRPSQGDLASFAQGVSLLVAALLFSVGFAGVLRAFAAPLAPGGRKALYILWALAAATVVVRAIARLQRHRTAWPAYWRRVFQFDALTRLVKLGWKVVKCRSCGGENRLGVAHCQYCGGALTGTAPASETRGDPGPGEPP